MDSEVVHSRVLEHDERHPHNTGSSQVAHHGTDEHHHDHEKKSVLKKVKAKAKKIKDTIKKHGHHDPDHDHDHHYEDQHIPDDHDLDEEDDEDDEDPEVHGAPIYESSVARSVIPGEEEPRQEPKVVVVSPNIETHENRTNESARARTFVGEEGNAGQRNVNLQGPIGLEEDPDAPGTTLEAHAASNYQSKVTDPTGAGAAEIDIAPVQKSFAKMIVHDEPKPNPEPNVLSTATQYPSGTAEMHEEQRHYESMDKPSNQSSYTDKISSDTSAIADKTITAENVIPSKLGYDDKGNRDHENEMNHGENQSSYPEKISSAISAIADKTVSAKNVVTSKIGYGGGDDNVTTTHEDHRKSEDANASSMSGTSTTEYGKKIAESVTEKLAPVYGKVAGVGSALKSKLSGTTNGADKGVSVKQYFAEKLRPGDEDRALSEVISETLHKRKGEPTKACGDEQRRLSEVISDAIHKRDEEPDEKAEHQRLGKVTESEEVKRRLGTVEEKDKRYEESDVNSSKKGVVDKLKDVAGSWFGKAQENQSSQVADGEGLSNNSGAEVGRVSQGERRLQESSD